MSGTADYPEYLMLKKNNIEMHFFAHPELIPSENYGQVYIRTVEIEQVYQRLLEMGIAIHPNGKLSLKPWGQKEFSLLDPDNNLLTFGESI